MEHQGIKINNDKTSFWTIGLSSYAGKELKIPKYHASEQDYFKLLAYLIDYLLKPETVIKPNETIAYHSWMLQFLESGDKYFEMWEVERSGGGYCPGVDYSITLLSEQVNECLVYNTTPVFPTFNQNIVISKGVYEGLSIEAIRYPSPSHMCGWWLITDEYDDDIKSLMNVHFYHVAFRRPDIIKYLGLPHGYRFILDANRFEAWYDEKIK